MIRDDHVVSMWAFDSTLVRSDHGDQNGLVDTGADCAKHEDGTTLVWRRLNVAEREPDGYDLANLDHAS